MRYAFALLVLLLVGCVPTQLQPTATPTPDFHRYPLPTIALQLESLRVITIQTGNTIGVNCAGTLILHDTDLLTCAAPTPTPTEVTIGTATVTPLPSPSASGTPNASTTGLPTLVNSATPTPTLSPLSMPSSTPPSGLTWYVSPNGSGVDGTSWATAWKELNAIGWASVKPGDRIELDGGSVACAGPFNEDAKPANCGAIYRTALTYGASGTSAAPITLELATDAGHDGTAIFFGGRATSLPSCNQTTYTNTTALNIGIATNGKQFVTLDGRHRSGIIQYGAGQGISVSGNNLTFRDLELFDDGVATHGSVPSSFGSPPYGSFSGWWSDGWGVYIGTSQQVSFDRVLVHDNGQDQFHGGSTFSNWTISRSWLYDSRENPQAPGLPFAMGPGESCTHVDGWQTYAGGPNSGLTITDSIIGPLLNQGIYPTDDTTPKTNNVTLADDLFLDVHFDAINTVNSAPSNWQMSNLTFYRFGRNNEGSYCCAIDGNSWPTGSTINHSIDSGGDLNVPGLGGSSNIQNNSNGATLPGGTTTDPQFAAVLATNSPTFSQYLALDLTARCAICAGEGSSLHRPSDILTLMDGP